MKFDMQLGGKFEAAIDQYGKAVARDVIYSGAATAAAVMRDEVRANVAGDRDGMPGVVTGNLRDSIYMARDDESSSDERATYVVSWNKSRAPHGHLLEFGTSRMAARPFVRPALAKLPEAIKLGLQRMRERAAGGGPANER